MAGVRLALASRYETNFKLAHEKCINVSFAVGTLAVAVTLGHARYKTTPTVEHCPITSCSLISSCKCTPNVSVLLFFCLHVPGEELLPCYATQGAASPASEVRWSEHIEFRPAVRANAIP